MPFITRNMVRHMKGGACSNPSGKRIRELPFNIDPDCKNKIEHDGNNNNNNNNKKAKTQKNHKSPIETSEKKFVSSMLVCPQPNPKNNTLKNKKDLHSKCVSRETKKVSAKHNFVKKTNETTKTIETIKTGDKSDNKTKNSDKSGGHNNNKKTDKEKEKEKDSDNNKESSIKNSNNKLSQSLGDESCEALYTYTLSTMKSNIKELCDTRACEPIGSKKYKNYTWNKQAPCKELKPTSCEEAYYAKSKEHPSTPMIVKIYNAKNYDTEESRFLKILQFLRFKHPNIISTYDIFNDSKEIFIFQKLEQLGNMKHYIKSNGVFKEALTQTCASHLLRAINYLGIMGISHRSIQPTHVLLSNTDDNLIFKLSGFHEAIDYWNSFEQEIFYKHCYPIEDAKAFDFKAPETFGTRMEVFDPVVADIWSYGATLFFSLTDQYPFSGFKHQVNISIEIEENVQKIKASSVCKEFLLSLLNINAVKRIHFNQMYELSWLEC